jgi:protein tyrosine phosphatase
MIWQESSQFILMITHETEKGRVKCCKYWPDINQQVKYDNLIIKCLEIKEFDDYLLRELSVSNLRNVKLLSLSFSLFKKNLFYFLVKSREKNLSFSIFSME